MSAPKSITRTTQLVTVTQGSTAGEVNSVTANNTISAIDATNAYVIIEGITFADPGDGIVAHVNAKAQLTSNTNVEVTATVVAGATPGNTSVAVTVHFTVVEWF